MFFYLVKNNYLQFITLPNDDRERERNIHILVYGCLCYIISHFIFVNLINRLSLYFWLILTLDCLTMYLLFNQQKNDKIEINDDFKVKNYDSDVEVDDLINELINDQ
mgnify:CR=1 FL=1